MPQISTSSPSRAAAQADGPIATLVYRSRAVSPLSMPALHELTEAARARNAREAITGLMLYDQGRFFQWLEGPPENIDRVMDSIRNDSRHTEIEVINNHAANRRIFGDWHMKLAAEGPSAHAWRDEVIKPPQEIVEGLRKQPDAAPSLLVRLVGVSVEGSEFTDLRPDVMAQPLRRSTEAVLRAVMLSTVIPRLALGHGIGPAQSRLPPASNRVSELAELLISADQSAAVELIREMQQGDGLIQPLFATLFEPAARKLGDLWSDDDCNEFDVTLGLVRLQTALRLLSAGVLRPARGGPAHPVVLVAPEPGELHHLGAVLDSDVLRNAGWAPRCEHPSDVKALQDLLSATWFDALDLSLSAAFRRDDKLEELGATIAEARRASRNPGLVVFVGGRVFVEEGGAGAQVGADFASRTSLGVDRSIIAHIQATKPPLH